MSNQKQMFFFFHFERSLFYGREGNWSGMRGELVKYGKIFGEYINILIGQSLNIS